MDLAIAQKLVVALAIGFVVGAERGWETRDAAPGARPAGMRTFALIGVLGGVSGLLAERFGVAVLATGFVGVVALALASYVALVRTTHDVGMTTEVALVLTYALAALASSGSMGEAVAATVVVTAILGYKRELHRGLAWLERREITATLQLLLLAAVALPLLPDRAMGPFDALNPRRIGLLVLLLVGVSYLGWFAVRLLGERAGLLLTAALGGLASSTAITLSYARVAHRRQAPVAVLAAGIVLACAIMAVRLGVVVSLVAPALALRLAAPLAALALLPAAAALLHARRMPDSGGAKPDLVLRNPLQLDTALGMAALITGLSLAVQAAQHAIGPRGVYAVALLSGVADVDAMGLSLAQAAGRGVELQVAGLGVIVAAASNTAAKAALTWIAGTRALARACAPPLLLGLLAALVLGWAL